MGKFIDLTDKKYGLLTVIKRVENDARGNPQWLCSCDCGNQTIARGYNLKNGNTSSCGCLNKISMSRTGKANKQYNAYDLSGEYGIGYTNKNEKFLFDLEDYDKIKNYCWFIDKSGYVMTVDGIMMHILIMNPQEHKWVDHIKHNKFDNRKTQLRLVTCTQNAINRKKQSNNTSGITGVYWNKNMQKWYAEIKFDKKRVFLGYYANFEDAVKARKEAEEKYFGEYSYENSMKEDIQIG